MRFALNELETINQQLTAHLAPMYPSHFFP